MPWIIPENLISTHTVCLFFPKYLASDNNDVVIHSIHADSY